MAMGCNHDCPFPRAPGQSANFDEPKRHNYQLTGQISRRILIMTKKEVVAK